jgi:beta-lactamase superfamily II metal-dependent hydrolase
MSGNLKIVVWDVQHGNAIYMRTPGGKDFMFDIGTGSYGDSDYEFSPLLHLKNNWNVGYLDGVIITHPHRDHLDDIFNFDKLNPQILYRPTHLSEKDIRAGNQERDKDIIDEYTAINNRFTSPIDPTTDAFLPANNGGVQIDVFVPRSCSTSNLNNHSIVTVVSFAESKIIIPGDNEPPSWNELLGRPSFISAIKGTDILIAPHHGRDSGFSSELFKNISPRLTIISDGPSSTTASNKYSNHSSGWTVHKRSGGKEERKCVTTRKDGVIEVSFGKGRDGRPFMEARID